MPVSKRSLRGRRYEKLRRWGFIEEEALEFSKRPELLKTPFFQRLRNQRLIQINNLKSKLKPGQRLNTDMVAYKRYVKKIKESYKKNDWYTQKTIGSRNRPIKRLIPLFLDPWKAIRKDEAQWKQKDTAYNSPSDKRHKDFQKDHKLINKEFTKQMTLFAS